jgi:FSR family fosmidomycin resistance protein-like MFS transporter
VRRYLPIACLALLHALVDAVATFIEPLWPELRLARSLSERDFFLLQAVTAVAPNFSQILFGFVRDRFGSRYLLWLGPAVATICLARIGLTESVAALALLLAIGYVGVGSFHPEAVVCTGTLLPEQRTRALSLFLFGGNLGLAIGPALSGNLVRQFDMGALAGLAVPFVLLIIGLHLLSRRAVESAEIPHAPAVHDATQSIAAQWKLAAYLLLVCSLRVIPSIGMNRALAFTLEQRGFGSDVIGNFQSLFLLSGSAGILLVGSRFGRRSERWLIIASSWTGIPLLIALASPACPTWLIVFLLVPTGVILNGTTPAMVSYAQQLFPRDTGMASALTMGVSYGTSGLAVAGMIAVIIDQFGQPNLLFAAFAPCLALAGLGAAALPQIILPCPAVSDT